MPDLETVETKHTIPELTCKCIRWKDYTPAYGGPKQFGDFYTHTLLIEQSTVRWVACLTMNKMSGADMNREIIIYNEHVAKADPNVVEFLDIHI